MSQSIETLGPRMRKRLAALEETIEQGLSAFVRVGEALAEIRDDRLYLQGYDTFDQYVRHRWQMSGTQAYRLIDAAGITQLLASPIGDTNGHAPILPRHESHTRALLPLREKPEVMRQVWIEVNADSTRDVTAEAVTRAVRDRLAASAPPGQVDTPEAEPEPSEPLLSVHIGVDLNKDQAQAALTYLLDCPRLPVGLLTVRAQIESQLVTLTR